MPPPPSPEPGSARFPDGPQALLLVAALVLAEALAGALLRDAQGLLRLQLAQRTAMAVLLGNALVFTAVMQLTGSSYGRLFHDSAAPRRVLLLWVVPPVLMLVPALLLVCGFTGWLAQQAFGLTPWETTLLGQLARPGLAVVLTVCVLAPVLEEMLFRGIVLRGFLTRYPRRAAIAASAVVFGIAHLNVHQFAVAVPLGLLLGWLYERTRSLLPGIALHAAYNGAVLLLSRQAADDTADWTAAGAWLAVSLLLAVPAWRLLRRLLGTASAG